MNRFSFSPFFAFLFFSCSMAMTVHGSNTDLQTAFEVRYEIWRKEVARNREFLPDDSGITLPSFHKGIVGLGVKSVPILIERMQQDFCLAYAITLITKWRFIPGERVAKNITSFKALAEFYSGWWQDGQAGIKMLFEHRYKRWQEVANSPKQEVKMAALRDLDYLGVAALPYFFEKIENNETAFISVVSGITQGAIKPKSSVEECGLWWEKNKEDWLIPFPGSNEKGPK